MKLRAGGLRDISKVRAEIINEWIGGVFMAKRRMSVKFAIAHVLLFDMRVGERWTAKRIARKAEEYLNQHIHINPNSASSLMRALFKAGKIHADTKGLWEYWREE